MPGLCVSQTGEVGGFDAQTLLINLVTALGLLAVATTLVDVLMTYILPEKDKYRGSKIEEVAVHTLNGQSSSRPEDLWAPVKVDGEDTQEPAQRRPSNVAETTQKNELTERLLS